MSTIEAPASNAADQATDDGCIIHVVCTACDPDLALCGEDMTGDEFGGPVDGVDSECVVCIDLEHLPCERCGQ
jgi:hypothetical protein